MSKTIHLLVEKINIVEDHPDRVFTFRCNQNIKHLCQFKFINNELLNMLMKVKDQYNLNRDDIL